MNGLSSPVFDDPAAAHPVRYNPAPVTGTRLERDGAPEDPAAVDIRLMERMVARDANAVGELYDRHSRLLFGLVLRILGHRNDAEEVLQEVFMAVWNRSETYNVALGPPVGWLVRVARNRAVDRLRANAVRLRTAESMAAPSAPIDTPETHAASSEQQRQVAQALSALPGEHRALIEQAYFLGLTQSELAERHKLPLGTVKTRIRTGMLTLRQCLSQSQIQ
jgi:RNA polymerase sigma-70 factor (ECF subfamily)